MNEFLQKIAYFFVNREHKLSKRIGVAASILIIALCLDYTFKASDYFITQKQLEQIEKIENIKKGKPDSLILQSLNEIEKRVISRQNYVDFTISIMKRLKKEINLNIVSKKQYTTPNEANKKVTNTTINNNSINNSISARSFWWHTISSSWVIIVIMILMIIATFMQEKITLSQILIMLLIEIICVSFAVAFSYLFSFIPPFPIIFYNYLLNLILSLLLVSIFIIIGRYIGKNSN